MFKWDFVSTVLRPQVPDEGGDHIRRVSANVIHKRSHVVDKSSKMSPSTYNINITKIIKTTEICDYCSNDASAMDHNADVQIYS
jgi:hypothetical protein